ncbi:hypothetical protein L2E82_35857 [Cichorium intybus]|uniref:Uncharacterized protein n=1 Tax=Cichorium intybus TaxID=13427 RepID=A0ACB9BQ14_CICIN|nr:hypothetical protein L2E82_35857 [Cichorium intybus]
MRKDDKDHQNEIEESNNLCPGRPLGRKIHSGSSFHKRKTTSNTAMDEMSLAQAHCYVLSNVESVTPFREIGNDGDDGVDFTPEMEVEREDSEEIDDE